MPEKNGLLKGEVKTIDGKKWYDYVYNCDRCGKPLTEGRANKIKLIFYPDSMAEKDDLIVLCLSCFRKFKKEYSLR